MMRQTEVGGAWNVIQLPKPAAMTQPIQSAWQMGYARPANLHCSVVRLTPILNSVLMGNASGAGAAVRTVKNKQISGAYSRHRPLFVMKIMNAGVALKTLNVDEGYHLRSRTVCSATQTMGSAQGAYEAVMPDAQRMVPYPFVVTITAAGNAMKT